MRYVYFVVTVRELSCYKYIKKNTMYRNDIINILNTKYNCVE